MKRHLIALMSACLSLSSAQVRASIIDGNGQNIAIPYDFDGIYLNVQTGATAFAQPGTWATEPWLNPFFGGTVIGNSASFLPIITGADQIVNLAFGTSIGAGGNFVAGPSGSSTHTGPAGNQFQVGVTGYIGYKFQWPGGGGQDHYGWMGVTVNDVGTGSIVNWAYENTAGTSILAGAVSGIPEPAQACCALLLAMPGACVLIRRRRQRGNDRQAA